MQMVTFLVIRTSRPYTICLHASHFAAVEVISVCVVCFLLRVCQSNYCFRVFVSQFHLQRQASWGCPGTSQPHRRQCSGYQWGRPTGRYDYCRTALGLSWNHKEKKTRIIIVSRSTLRGREEKRDSYTVLNQFYEAVLALASKQVRGSHFCFLPPLFLIKNQKVWMEDVYAFVFDHCENTKYLTSVHSKIKYQL